MKTSLYLPLFLAGITALTTLVAAEKQKKSELSSYPFWTTKKRGYVPQFAPGLNAVLQLTAEQKEQIASAAEEMSNDPVVKAARAISKSDPSVTAEQREKARVDLETATTRLHEKVAAMLTAEQRALIERINAAHAAASEEIGIIYEDKFGSVKDLDVRRRIQEEKNQDLEEQFLQKIDGFLTASQKEAMTRAAEEEIQRNVKAVANKKPAK